MHDVKNMFYDNPPVIIFPTTLYCLDCWSQFPNVDMTGKMRDKCVYCESTNIHERIFD